MTLAKKYWLALLINLLGLGSALAEPIDFPVAPEPILQTFLDLVRLPSPSGHEEPVRLYLEKRLQQLQIPQQSQFTTSQPSYKVDAMGNLILWVPSKQPSQPTLLMDTHMDVVPPCLNIQPQIQHDPTLSGENRVVYSGGDTVLGGDDKAAIAPLLEALAYTLKTNQPHPNLLLVFTVQEEVGALGAKALDPQLYRQADLLLSFDINGNQGTVVYQAPQLTLWQAEVIGKNAHAGIEPEKGVNALKAATLAVSQMSLGRLDADTTVNIGTFSSGEKFNIVPGSAHLTGDVRSFSTQRVDQELTLIQQAFTSGTQQVPGSSFQFQHQTWIPAYTMDLTLPIFTPLKQALQESGLEFQPIRTLGGSDLNLLSQSGIPGVVLSGAYQNPHQTSEFVRVRDMALEAKLILDIWKHYSLQAFPAKSFAQSPDKP